MSNNNNYGLNRYKTTSVTTASRGQVLLMLYEGCIKFCKLAIEATKARDLAGKGTYILKVQDIINELSLTLNHEQGGDIAKELERLYNYMVDQLTEANIKNDHKPLEIVLKLLETLYEGWAQAVQQVGLKHGGDIAAAAAAEMNDATTKPASSAANVTPQPGITANKTQNSKDPKAK